MHGDRFSIKNAIHNGWHTSKNNIGFFSLLLIISFLIALIPVGIGNFFADVNYIVNLIIHLAGKVLGIVIYLGIIKISLKFCYGEKTKLDDLLSSFHLIFKFIPAIVLSMIIFYGIFFIFLGISFLLGRQVGENFIVSAIIFMGVIALIIFFVVWTIRLSFSPYFIVDEEYGAIKALKASYYATKGKTMRLLFFELLLGLINVAGEFLLLAGLLITIPLYLMARAYVYEEIASGGKRVLHHIPGSIAAT